MKTQQKLKIEPAETILKNFGNFEIRKRRFCGCDVKALYFVIPKYLMN